MFIGDTSVGRLPVEELGDAERLLGGWGAVGVTVVQGGVIDSQGHTFWSHSQSTSTISMYLYSQAGNRQHKHVPKSKGVGVQL